MKVAESALLPIGPLRAGAAVVAAALIGAAAALAAAELPAEIAASLIWLPGGTFVMGSDAGEADERPQEVTVAAFRLMRHEVTNRQFARFVAGSRHVTDPERRGFGFVWDGRWRRRPASPRRDRSVRGDRP